MRTTTVVLGKVYVKRESRLRRDAEEAHFCGPRRSAGPTFVSAGLSHGAAFFLSPDAGEG